MTMDAATLELLAGKEFNATLAGDVVLKELEKSQYNNAEAKQLLLEILGVGDYRIGKLPVRPLTAAKWAFLWMLESPLVTGGAATIRDLDIFLYVASQIDLREIPCAVDEISEQAEGFALATELEAEQLFAEVKSMIQTAFRPFEMMPVKKSANSPEDGVYDGVWANFMAGVAAKESAMTFDYCLHNMSLANVCTFYVNYYRRESLDGRKVRRNVPQKIKQQIEARIDLLAEEYIAKINQE